MTTTHRRPLSSLENICKASTGQAEPTVKNNKSKRSIKSSLFAISKYDELRSIVDNYILDPIIARQANTIISELQLDASPLRVDKSNEQISSMQGKENDLTESEAPTEHFISEQLDCVVNQTAKDSPTNIRSVNIILTNKINFDNSLENSTSELPNTTEQEVSIATL